MRQIFFQESVSVIPLGPSEVVCSFSNAIQHCVEIGSLLIITRHKHAQNITLIPLCISVLTVSHITLSLKMSQDFLKNSH